MLQLGSAAPLDSEFTEIKSKSGGSHAEKSYEFTALNEAPSSSLRKLGQSGTSTVLVIEVMPFRDYIIRVTSDPWRQGHAGLGSNNSYSTRGFCFWQRDRQDAPSQNPSPTLLLEITASA